MQVSQVISLCGLFAALQLSACRAPAEPSGPIRVLINYPPLSLHPRRSIDGIGQRIGSLFFGSLTRMGADLRVEPSHAVSWSHSRDGLAWSFRLAPGLTDHSGKAISVADWVACLEAYRTGKPTTALLASFPHWRATDGDGDRVTLRFSQPDPYIPVNLTLLRFYRDPEGTNCPAAPTAGPIIASGDYAPPGGRLAEFSPQTEVIALSRKPEFSNLRFLFVKDDNTRALLLARGSADAAINAFSTSKYKWMRETLSDRYRILEREGVNVSYLAFNLKRPLLADSRVRRAIALAIPRKDITRTWLRDLGTVAHGFISPLIAESPEAALLAHPATIRTEDPAQAERLLDEAGVPRGTDGTRTTLKYLTTSIREGYETGLLMRDVLARIGIRLTLEVVEPSVFINTIRGGNYDLFSSRWIGVSDASILYTAYFSGAPRNRIKFSDPSVDQALLAAMAQMDDSRRKALFETLQLKLDAETAYFPLWYWSNSVVVSKKLTGLEASETSASGAYEPLGRLRRLSGSHE
jgi:peptide/nickel transport system substrate-binding protein